MNITKKWLSLLLALVLVVSLFAGCASGTDATEPSTDSTQSSSENTESSANEETTEGTKETEHTHTWTDAACTAPKTCSACGVTEGEALGYTWIEPTCSAPKTCSTCGTTEGTNSGRHILGTDNLCTICGQAASTGLEFELSSDGTYYILTNADNCPDSVVVVPAYHEGLPVKAIDFHYTFWNDDPFNEGKLAVTAIHLPDTITVLDCTFPHKLKSIIIPGSVASVGGFQPASRAVNELTTVILEPGVTTIKDTAFYQCRSLRSVTIPVTVTSIGIAAFGRCHVLSEIHYGGTMAQWESLPKGDDWDVRAYNYTVYCTDGTVKKG